MNLVHQITHFRLRNQIQYYRETVYEMCVSFLFLDVAACLKEVLMTATHTIVDIHQNIIYDK